MIRLAPFLTLFIAAQFTVAAANAQVAHSHSSSHPHGCAPPTCKVCIQEPSVVKTKKTVYTFKTVEYCLKKCGCCCCCSCLFGHQASCPECGPVHCKRVLYKKTVTEECPSFECKVVERPVACAHCASTPPHLISTSTPVAEMPRLINQPLSTIPTSLPEPPAPTRAPALLGSPVLNGTLR